MNNTRTLYAHVPYEHHHHDDDVVSHTIHFSITSTIGGVIGPMDLFGSGAYVPPFASSRVLSQHGMLDLPHNTATPRIVRPRLTNHNDPLFLENHQQNGLEKLRREIYNPVIQQRRSLYYRDYDFQAKSRENEDGKKLCIVCLDEFEPREMVTLTPCNHMFHENCIAPWVKSHGQCPVCRFVISEVNR